MLDIAFEQKITDLLRTHYELELCHLKELSNEKDCYKTFRFQGKDSNTNFFYPLRMTIETYNERDVEYHSFLIFSEDIHCRSSINIVNKIYPSAIEKALVEIKNEIPKFFMDYRFMYLLGHYKISLISGIYYNNGINIVVNDLVPFVETVSNIFFFSPILSTSSYTFCSVNIKGDKLYVTPTKGYENDPAFDKPVTFDDDGIKLFKAYIFKCLLIYSNSSRYNTSDYLSLDYDAMKNYFLLLDMERI